MPHTRRLPRILCVDDNHDVADSSVDLLTAYGYEARACYNGPSGLAALDVFAPDVCLIDLNMPGMDGDEVAVRLRKTGRRMALVAVTAASHESAYCRIVAAGFDLHLIKPVDPRLLAVAINSLLRTAPIQPTAI